MIILKEWVSNLFILIVSLTFAEMLAPNTTLGKYLKYIFSLIIMAAVIYPIANLLYVP